MNDIPPLCLPREICELIFDFLSPCDLLRASRVDRKFLNFIENTKAIDKLILKIDENVSIEEVMKSRRKFTNLILEKLQHEKIIRIFRKFNETVKKLELKDDQIAAKKGIKKFLFKSLEELTLSNISGRILFPLMKFQQKLKVLNLWHLRGGIETALNFARINGNLKELNLYLNESSNFFHQDVSKFFRFNLQTVTISFKSNFELDDRTIGNIENFLKSQGESLQTVTLINACDLSPIYKIWNSLVVVEKLCFFSADFFNLGPVEFELDDKTRLKSLEVHVLGPVELKLYELQPLLTASSNLKSLGIWNLNEDFLQLAAENLAKLSRISCATMTSNCQRFYDQLKTKSGINTAIELHQYL
jgi:hypothetical protein